MGLFDNSARLFNMSFPWGMGRYRQISSDDEILPADSESLSIYVDEKGTVNVSESLVLYKSNDPIDGGVEHTYSKGNLFIQGLNKALTTVPIGGIILYPTRLSSGPGLMGLAGSFGLAGTEYLQDIPEGFVPCLGQTLTYPDGSTFRVPYLPFSWTKSTRYLQRVPLGTFRGLNDVKVGSNVSDGLGGLQFDTDGNITSDGNITTNGDITTNGNIAINGGNNLRFSNSSDDNSVALRAPNTINTDVVLTLPATDGDADQVLKTDGNGALDWVSLNFDGRLIGAPQVLTSGTTYTAPANCTGIYVECVGGGGGGGSYVPTFGVGTGTTTAGGGGGGAGYSAKYFTVTPSTTYNYAVGAGGVGNPLFGSAGTSGGNTTFTVGETTIIANGGGGGTAYGSFPGGGGGGSGGDINAIGQSGFGTTGGQNAMFGKGGGNGGASAGFPPTSGKAGFIRIWEFT
jgi:hypothetical protein